MSASSQSGAVGGSGVTRVRSKTGLGSSGQLLPRPSFPALLRKGSVVSVAETEGQRLEYLFCLAGDMEGTQEKPKRDQKFFFFFFFFFFTKKFFQGVTAFLRLLFESDNAFSSCSFVRYVPRFKNPEDNVRVSFHPLVGYGSTFGFDDEVLRKCEGVIFVHHVQRDLTSEFLQWRKRIGNVRAEAKGVENPCG